MGEVKVWVPAFAATTAVDAAILRDNPAVAAKREPRPARLAGVGGDGADVVWPVAGAADQVFVKKIANRLLTTKDS